MTNDKLTIVGPEPTNPENRSPQKKVNIEALLLMAKYDEHFKEKLFADRAKALLESGITFTAGEKLLLSNISNEQLADNIREFRVPGITKNSLTNWAKAAAVILLLTSVVFIDVQARAEMTKEITHDGGKVCYACHPLNSAGITTDKPKADNTTQNNFTQIKNFTYHMRNRLDGIRIELRKGKKIEDILKEYDSIISNESNKPDSEKRIKPEAIKLIKEIEEKIKTGQKIEDIINKYEEIFPEPILYSKGITPDMKK